MDLSLSWDRAPKAFYLSILASISLFTAISVILSRGHIDTRIDFYVAALLVTYISSYPLLLYVAYVNKLHRTIILSLSSIIWGPLLAALLIDVFMWGSMGGGNSMEGLFAFIFMAISALTLPHLLVIGGILKQRLSHNA